MLVLSLGCVDDYSQDWDGDGYAAAEDCDDTDDTVGSGEVTTWYRDCDGDGWGDAERTASGCFPDLPGDGVDCAEGDDNATWASAAGDCCDQCPDQHPGAAEIAHDGVDQDCDGADRRDVDGDGHDLIAIDADGVESGTDCDDDDASVNPDATEIWYDDVDQDCDGNLYDADGDGFPPIDLGGLDCDDLNPFVHPYAVEVCNDGQDNDCNGNQNHCELSGDQTLDDADASRWGVEEYDHAAWAVPLGDHNSDGYDDLLIGAHQADREGGYDEGIAYVVLGPLTGHQDLADAPYIYGERAEHRLGQVLAGDGDANGDGFTDVLMGASSGTHDPDIFDQDGMEGSGFACLVPGLITAATGMESHACFYGEVSDEDAGLAVAFLDDLNDDGMDDVAITSSGKHTGSRVGAVSVMLSPFEPGWTSLAEGARRTGLLKLTRLGVNLATADLDGDGFEDLILGDGQASLNDYEEGGVYVIAGPVTGVDDLWDPDLLILGDSNEVYLGDQVAAAGDVDGDGHQDLAIGSSGSRDDGSNSQVWLFQGPLDLGGTSLTRHSADATVQCQDERGAITLTDLTGAGDVNGDGLGDMLLGASSYDHDGDGDGVLEEDEHEHGAAFLMAGPLAGGLDLEDRPRFIGAMAGENAGARVAGPGDVNRDGLDDIVIGASAFNAGEPPLRNGNEPMYGGVFLYLGASY